MHARLGELAARVGGVVVGDADRTIEGVAILGEAGPGEITFIDAAEKATRLSDSRAAAAIVPRDVNESRSGIALLQVDNPVAAFTQIHQIFHPPRQAKRVGISPGASINQSATIGNDVDIYPGATIAEDVVVGDGTTIHAGVHIMAGCRIGRHVTIFPGAVLYENTIVGDHVIIHAAAVLGAYGFGYRTTAGRHEMVPQLGHVVIEAHVEIGAGTTIDRATFGSTRIGEGSKLDNQVMIGHNCRIGRHNLLCSQVGIAGSTTTGDYVVMGGQVGVVDHVNIGHRVRLGAQSGVGGDVADDDRRMGSPAVPGRDFWRQVSALNYLPEMRREFKALAQKVEEIIHQAETDQRNAA